MMKKIQSLVGMSALVFSLAACSTVSESMGSPELTPIQNPQRITGLVPVSTPLPAALPQDQSPNSLWRTGARSFFKDQRASTIGDILTVEIDITDTASLSNSTSTSRTGNQSASIDGLFGLEAPLERAPPAHWLHPPATVPFGDCARRSGHGADHDDWSRRPERFGWQ